MNSKTEATGRRQAMTWARRAAWTVCMAAGVTAGAQMVSPPGRHIAPMPEVAGVGAGIGAGAGAGVGAGQDTQPPVKDDLFAGTEIFAKGASNVNEITMDPDTLDLVGGKDGKRAHSMILNVVRTYSYDKPGMYRIEDVDAFRNKLNSGDWHCSVHSRDLKAGESTDICNKQRSDGFVETAIITVEPKQLTFIHTIRRRNGNEQSEGSGFPLIDEIPRISSLAMLDPQVFVDMQMAMSHLNVNVMVDNAAMSARINSAMKNLHELDKPLHELDRPEMQKKIDKAMKGLKERQKDWKMQMKPNGMAPLSNLPKGPE
jgi:hypothetical protein